MSEKAMQLLFDGATHPLTMLSADLAVSQSTRRVPSYLVGSLTRAMTAAPSLNAN